MKLLSFETVTGGIRRHHLGALVDGDADSGLVIDLTAAAEAHLLSQGISGDDATKKSLELCPPTT
jgi:hypothetical protein